MTVELFNRRLRFYSWRQVWLALPRTYRWAFFLTFRLLPASIVVGFTAWRDEDDEWNAEFGIGVASLTVYAGRRLTRRQMRRRQAERALTLDEELADFLRGQP